MPSQRHGLLLGGALLLLGTVFGAVPAAHADVDVVIGYETRAVGELEQCG
ncbi:MAG: hypothetical protein R3C71_15585 [Candidatus Krumholzibacteriia bacterium]|nr:hypothetical protein [bacterium]MCB9514166.1 hypothetical protein [Candidatus Latescibacterota bacterium]MCB9515825.1 hypothetical protein [Candidatus Latescibacterota bacterium]